MDYRLKLVLFFILVFGNTGCTEHFENLSLNEQAIDTATRFSNDSTKDQYRKPLDILEFSGITTDMKVVDLLGGGGYYSELFSYIVGKDGQVYLQNNSLFLRFSKDEIEERLKNNRLTNVVRLDSDYADMKLPEGVDIMFLGLSFHDFFVKREDPVISANPDAFFAQAYQSLKPGGTLIIIDHAARPESRLEEWAPLHRIEESWARAQLEMHGFKFEAELNVLRNFDDDYSLDIWNKKVFHKTDRFVHKYRKVEK